MRMTQEYVIMFDNFSVGIYWTKNELGEGTQVEEQTFCMY